MTLISERQAKQVEGPPHRFLRSKKLRFPCGTAFKASRMLVKGFDSDPLCKRGLAEGVGLT
jgi:hypothetical protein